ncbi:GDP dissociation inhibitor [Trinorchestia longiramus]|nr:GDP dissociation inhibitor [Trinorchestia longiramus]
MEKYDVLILGTGLVESVLSANLSINGIKILHIDKNTTYGSDIRSCSYVDLANLYKVPLLDELSNLSRHFSIDLVPKVLLNGGRLQNLLDKYDITPYIEFSLIPSSYVYTDKCYKVPLTEKEVLKSPLIGLWRKHKLVSFLWDVKKYGNGGKVVFKKTMREQFKYLGVDDLSELLGHAVALNLDDSYLDRDPKETYEKICLYVRSIQKLGNYNSPYLYPLYGLSELSQCFCRKSAIHGTTFRLDTPVLSIKPSHISSDTNFEVEFYDKINNKKEKIAVKYIISDPTYFPEHVHVAKKVIRCTCIVRGVPKMLPKEGSSQIIFLSSKLKRKNDIYALFVTDSEKAAPEGYYVVLLSTIVETDYPEQEVEGVVMKLGNVVQRFYSVTELLEPAERLPGHTVLLVEGENIV